MPPKLTENELEIAIRLLKKNSSINAVSAYLKRRELTYSATSWDAMRDDRLKPALESGSLDRSDIVQLLRDSEEYGRQHVFLFKCSKTEAGELTNEKYLRKRLSTMDLEDLLDAPRIVEKVPGQQLVEARIEHTSEGNYFVAKLVDVRRYRREVGRKTEGNEQTITYHFDEDRVVNVLRVAADGMTEVRVQAHRNAVDYPAEAENVYGKLAGIIDRLTFEDLSLAKARRYMIENRRELSKYVKYGMGLMRTKKGAPITFAAANWSENMFGGDDEEAEATMTTLLTKGAGRSKCDTVNFTWLKQPGGAEPASDIHIYLGGRNNELYVVPQCTRSDYLYVLGKIISYAK